MRIVIDMQGAQTDFSAHRGVGRYTVGLVKALLAAESTHEFILVLNGYYQESIERIRSDFKRLIKQENIKVWHQDLWFCGADKNTYTNMRISEVIREAFIASHTPDIVFSTNLQEGFFEPAPTSVNTLKRNYISITTLHDVIPIINSEHYLSDATVREWYFEKINGVNKSDLVLTVSNSSRAEIIKCTKILADKIFSIENAVDHNKFKKTEISISEKEDFRKRFGLTKQYILYAGGNDEHKDLITLYKAYSKLPTYKKKITGLMLIGKELKDDEQSIRLALKDLGVTQNIIIPGRLSDDDLIKSYNLASVFVFPSTHEGFGLPPLEAMACGIPVLVSSAPSLSEIIDEKSAIFEIGNSNELALKILKVLQDDIFSAQLSSHNLRRSSEYTWEASAEKFLKIIETLSNTRSIKPEDPLIEKVIDRIGTLLYQSGKYDDDYLCSISNLIDTNIRHSHRKQTIFIDISAIIFNNDHTGIQRVVRAISSELLTKKTNDINIVLVYSTPQSNYFYQAHHIEENWSNSITHTFTNSHERVVFYQNDVLLYLDLHPSLAIAKISTNRKLKAAGVAVYHVVYDLLPYQFSHYFWPELCNEFNIWLNSIFNSTGAICISKTVADDLLQWSLAHNVTKNFEINWFHLGANLGASVPSKGLIKDIFQILEKIHSKPTFIMVGTIEPRKGHRQVFDAFKILWKEGLDANLFFIGKNGWNSCDIINDINSFVIRGNNVTLLEGLSDETLEKIYNASTCLISASYGEGFGLPLIEAAQHKLPIIARDIPVFREVAKKHAFYFKASQPEELASVILEWLALYEKGNHPKSDDMPWLTWEDSANLLLKTMGIKTPLVQLK